jgi:hypothetical protein
MAVVSSREVLPRTFSHKFGEPPTAECKWVLTVDEPTPTQQCIDAIGIYHGSQHPEYSYLSMIDASASELDRHHVEIVYRYGVNELDPNPLARPDVWSFSIGGARVPALAYYHGTDNNDIRPLVNAANDFIEGLETVEAEVKATIAGNRAQFPLSIAAAVTNGINSSPYLGGAQYTWQCAGISGQQATEVVNDIKINYYQITCELVYRARGWIDKIPHVGWHFIDGGQKRRAWVWSQDGEYEVDASAPQPLNDAGNLKFPGGNGLPDQLQRRMFPAFNFSQYFGTPPF